ncbi:MAG TPA: universal stress protein [Phenylobacterium sp.]
MGGEVTALALHVHIDAPRNRLADLLLDFQDLVKSEEARSTASAWALARSFEDAAASAGAPTVIVVQPVELYGEAERFCAHARGHDLTMMPIGPSVLNDRSIAEAVIFGSGRPVLLFPESEAVASAARIETAVVAWDGSRPAARALADALPLLTSVSHVRVLSILDEKPGVEVGTGARMVRHLALHGIRAVADEVDAKGEKIAHVMRAYLKAQSADLLVMGAYGHSRAREFVLGGATSGMFEDLTLPVLMSH